MVVSITRIVMEHIGILTIFHKLAYVVHDNGVVDDSGGTLHLLGELFAKFDLILPGDENLDHS